MLEPPVTSASRTKRERLPGLISFSATVRRRAHSGCCAGPWQTADGWDRSIRPATENKERAIGVWMTTDERNAKPAGAVCPGLSNGPNSLLEAFKQS